MFERCRELLERYHASLLGRGATRQAKHLLLELRPRLRQLDWIYDRLLEIEAEILEEQRQMQGVPKEDGVLVIYSDTASPDPKFSNTPKYAHDELHILLEAFYYSAFRVQGIFNGNKDSLPGVPKFDAVSVRNVRNHLVEHPGGKSGVIVSSHICGPSGPRLRPVRWSLDPPGTQDDGLRPNAAEFEAALRGALESALRDA